MDRQRIEEIMRDCSHKEDQYGECFGSQYGQENEGETPHE
jgi:hypothetical protein